MQQIAERRKPTSTNPPPPTREAGWRRAQVIEQIEAHYQVHEVPYGQVYRWCPGCVVVECDCGEGLTLTSSIVTCDGCGADHTAIVTEELAAGRLGDEALHPWRYAGDREDVGLPF